MNQSISLLRPNDERALCVWRNGFSPLDTVFRIVAKEFGAQYHEFSTFEEAQYFLLNRRVSVLLVDVHHPRSPELVKFAGQHAPDIPVVLLLPSETFQVPPWTMTVHAEELIFLPCTLSEARFRLGRVLKSPFPLNENRANRSALSAQTTPEPQEMLPAWNPSLLETVEALFATLYLGDVLVATHSLRTAAYASVIAQAIGMTDGKVQVVRLASLLHDIGKLGIAKHVLYKAGELSEEEFEHVKDHVEFGLLPIKHHRLLRPLVPIVRHVHENFDGSGYPDGIAGHEIPLESRIIAVADAFDALTTDRPYRPALPAVDALRVLRMNAGSQWDPELVTLVDDLYTRQEFRLIPPEAEPRTLDYGSIFDWLASLEDLVRGGKKKRLLSPKGNLRALKATNSERATG